MNCGWNRQKKLRSGLWALSFCRTFMWISNSSVLRNEWTVYSNNRHDSVVHYVLHAEDNNPSRMSHKLDPGGIQCSCSTLYGFWGSRPNHTTMTWNQYAWIRLRVTLLHLGTILFQWKLIFITSMPKLGEVCCQCCFFLLAHGELIMTKDFHFGVNCCFKVWVPAEKQLFLSVQEWVQREDDTRWGEGKPL